MHSLDWDNIHHFLEVVRCGSVSQAALRLGVNQTTVSRRIGVLEKGLGKPLFERNGNRWLITPMGEQLIQSAERMAEEANTIERQVMADNQELRGKLRITVADVCTQYLVMPSLELFARQYPEVDLEVIATPEELNLAAREADVALRTTDAPPANLVGKRVAQLAYAVYASHALYERIMHESDSSNIPCITWIGDGYTKAPWIERSFPQARHIYRCSELGIMWQMVQQGIGIAQIPCVFGDTDPKIKRVPAPYVEPGWGLWVLSHVDLRSTARVRIFRDFLVEQLEQKKDLIEGRLG